MTEGRPLDGAEIRSLIVEVADELPVDDPPRTIVVVGGSLLSMRGLRPTTVDVDTVRRLDDTLRWAIEIVGHRHHLAPTWLNDRAAPWLPSTFNEAECDLLVDHPRLKVLGASMHDVFLMKLDRSGPQDYADLVALWPFVAPRFTSATEVVMTYRRAFPATPEDPHLDEFIVEIAAASGRALPID